MKASSVHAVYFSATYTTRKVIREIADRMNTQVIEHDITQRKPENPVQLPEDSLLIVGIPVYAGRIPALAVEALKQFEGRLTPAIIVCVYGNRDYDDALLELHDLVIERGFKPVSAAAFIAQHSIFPTVGTSRPDQQDLIRIQAFADESRACLETIEDTGLIPDLKIKGNSIYKTPGKIPLAPKGNRRCDQCGTCARLCPVEAIPADKPRTTDKQKCIACGRCIVVCPQDARHFGGLLYSLVKRKFTKANAARKEPEIYHSIS